VKRHFVKHWHGVGPTRAKHDWQDHNEAKSLAEHSVSPGKMRKGNLNPLISSVLLKDVEGMASVVS
jgi:hypothetical protein